MSAMLRWPQLAIRCPWCHAAPGQLCSSARGVRRYSTHPGRRDLWVRSIIGCPVEICDVDTGMPCRNDLGWPIASVHAERDQAAVIFGRVG